MTISYLTRRLLILCLCLSLAGCSGSDRNWKETVPVIGEVFVNGQAAEGVMVEFHPVGGMDQAQPTMTKAITGQDGTFEATTYEVGDGAPTGEYQVTFTWPKLNKISMTFDGDELKGKYAKPTESEFQLTVESGKPIDMGRIEL